MNKTNKKGLSKHLIAYEIRNATGSVITIFFGVIFPLFMALIFSNVIAGQVPVSEQNDVRTSIFLSMMMIIPMSATFIGYAATYSQELEHNVPMRLDLFGMNKHSVMIAKMIANLIFLLASTAIYFAVCAPLIKMDTPTFPAVVLSVVIVVLIGAILLVIAHSIANIAGKFSTTYACTMILYFGFMIVCGIMGLQVSDFPPFLQGIAKLLPMTYFGSADDFLKVWKGESYNPARFILSFVFLAAIAAIIWLISIWKNRRKKST